MPSPLGHSLASLLLRAPFEPKGWLLGRTSSAWWRSPFTAVALGNLPDLDLIGSWLVSGHMATYHHDFTHNIGLALAAGLMVALGASREDRLLAGFWGFALVALHSLLDAGVGPLLGGATLGVPALWPLTNQTYGLPWAFIQMLHFGPNAEILSWANASALLHETVLFGAPFALVLWLKK